MGVVDLFGDITYSAGASMNGLFLGSLGASAALISIAGGLSEFLNYLTRAVSGYAADRTGHRWPMVFAGYVLNLFAVPALALAGQWPIAASLIIIQGLGRGIRKPVVQGMLAHTTGTLGRGWVYGVHDAFDKGGRTIGPLLVALVLVVASGAFGAAYSLLALPAVVAIVALTVARIGYPAPAELDDEAASTNDRFAPAYWLHLIAGALFAAGLMNFELISVQLVASGASRQVVPLSLALATGFGAIASPGVGKLYDRIGFPIVIGAVMITAAFSPLVFLLPLAFAFVGMVLWGIGQITEDMFLESVVAAALPEGRRNFAFGLFYAGYGLGWLTGAVVTGLLYEQSRVALVIFAVTVQLASIPIFFLARRAASP